MSASAILQTRQGTYCVVQAEIPDQDLVNLGVLLRDPQTDALYVRLRRDMQSLAEEEDLEVLEALAADLTAKAGEMGAEKLLAYLETTLSATIRVTDQETVLVDNFTRALDRLYRKNVQSQVQEFRTHLPRYSLKAAAGKFLENEEVTGQGWMEAPQDLRLAPEMFIAEIAGHSMEPLIPDGALCVFRHGVAGSRQGRLVLAESLEDTGNNRYAVKRYQSTKVETEEGWRHERIRLESLNPDYPSWDLDPDENKYRIIAEFIRVMD
jgi:phage repressor protein C with HTH and peptisase S24 domain